MIEALADWNPWWTGKDLDPALLGKNRELTKRAEELLSFREMKILLGLRRSGKSTLFYQFIDHLLRKGTDPKDILLVNFEDPILSRASLNEVFDQYQSDINPDSKPYIFLDEVHRCRKWVLFLRKLYDLRKIEQVFITDSSSRLVEREQASVLTGRGISTTVYPLSFREHLDWKGRRMERPLSSEDRNKLKNSLNDHLRWGGMPEVVLKESNIQKKTLLNNYLSDIVHKDIGERYNTDYRKIKDLVDYLVTNTGNLFSPRKYSRTYGLSLDAINNYLNYLEEVFLFVAVSRFDYSLRTQQITPKKIYLLDTGFFGSAGFRFSEDAGHIYENAVFLQLNRKLGEIYYWKDNGREVDFLVKEGKDVTGAIQVCYDLENARDRELRPLLSAMNEFAIEEGMVITGNFRDVEVIGGKRVKYVPLWEWLL